MHYLLIVQYANLLSQMSDNDMLMV